MARTVTGRLLVTGDLVARTAIHVGGMGEDHASDMPLARDGAGRFVIPGTSLAGAFRQWCRRAFGEQAVHDLWGSHDESGAASLVTIEDIVAGDDESAFVEIRDGVGIDREWGTAADAIKYDRAVLPRGTKLPLVMAVEYDSPRADAAARMAAGLVAALAEGEVSLGAAKTRGLGRVVLERPRIERFDLDGPAGTLALLRRLAWDDPAGNRVGDRPAPSAVVPPAAAPHAPPRLSIEIDWRPLGPLMVKAGADGIAVDTLPLLGGCEGGLALLLPGSSVKGVLRSQAERIIRTLLDLPLSSQRDPKRRFLEQAREVPLVGDLFGQAGETSDAGEAPDHEGGPLPGLGAVGVDDCYGQHRMARDAWDRVLTADIEASQAGASSPLRSALDKAGAKDWTAGFHVAVDRWTGSTADSALFTVLEPHAVAWEPIRLAVDLERLPQERQAVAVALVMFLVRDLAAGRLPLGFGTNRGMGAIAVETVRLRGRGLPGPLATIDGVSLAGGDVAGLPAAVRDALDAAWLAWLDHASEEVPR